MKAEGEKKRLQRQATTRIETLFAQIRTLKPFNQEVADRYLRLVWQLSTKHKIRLASANKRSFCRKCKSYWRPGKTVRVRVQKSRIIYTCLVCGAIRRIHLHS
ncbi:MAG: RNAase P [Nanoarchaeota archaeon]